MRDDGGPFATDGVGARPGSRRALLGLALSIGMGACEPRDEGEPAPPPKPRAPVPEAPAGVRSIAVWHVPGAPPDFAALREILEGPEVRVESMPSYESWVASDADVLVMRATDDTAMPSEDEFVEGLDLAALEGRRVIGLGGEAGRVFGALGLEVSGGHTATFPRARPHLSILTSALLPPDTAGSSVVAFDAKTLAGGPDRWDCEALFIQRRGAQAGPVEVMARWSDAQEYAPIARQQNYVLCGITADARTWTPAFRRIVREMAHGLSRRPLEPFALAEWQVTPPGTYPVEMKRSLSEPDETRREYYFRFERPVLFAADLVVEAGDQVMLFFHREHDAGDGERLDGKTGDALRIVHPVTASSIRANRGRYWRLSVTNFGWRPLRGTLRIAYEEGATLRFADGIAVSLDAPPTDPAIVSRLMEFLDAEDPMESKRAAAALVAIGPPALGPLEAAEDRLRWPADRDRILRLARISGDIERAARADRE